MDNSKYKILIVDDDKDVREILQFNIKKEGYKTYTAQNGEEALKLVKKKKPQLIILDVMMPVMDGYQTCTEIRKLPNQEKTIIIFLSARGEDYSQIIGFEAGGDDYVTKPITPKVLLSRIKALLKRFRNQAKEKEKDHTISFGKYKLDKSEYVLYKGKEQISLPKKQFEILGMLAAKPNHVFSREEIFEEIWGEDVIVGPRTIDVHIRKIREKTGIENLQTVKGIGYKLVQ